MAVNDPPPYNPASPEYRAGATTGIKDSKTEYREKSVNSC
jgi:hypothetical protein